MCYRLLDVSSGGYASVRGENHELLTSGCKGVVDFLSLPAEGIHGYVVLAHSLVLVKYVLGDSF